MINHKRLGYQSNARLVSRFTIPRRKKFESSTNSRMVEQRTQSPSWLKSKIRSLLFRILRKLFIILRKIIKIKHVILQSNGREYISCWQLKNLTFLPSADFKSCKPHRKNPISTAYFLEHESVIEILLSPTVFEKCEFF